MTKVLAISSQGGHWIQLKRICPAFEQSSLVMVSTFILPPSLPNSCTNYYSVVDASRWNKLKLIKQACQVFLVIRKEKPDKIITTGASVGLWAIIAGRLFGAKTIWLDSIANFEQISLSGRLAKAFAHIHMTQWSHLITSKTIYKGAVI
ncbi:hypothetical protein [uncultured Draconibacterium sp.]|uniref:hypothetical protein n=1 Tax=uncultured Draconibacterium sp. TaxID=1573823 RepID=UPI0029C90813|nr:hypothetical protein [uncultured Draconibacterium sp.]